MDSDDEALEFYLEEKTETPNYIVLTKAEIRRRQEDDITSVSTVLSIPRSAAATLLFHYAWSVNAVQEAWFADEAAVRKEVGLIHSPAEEERSRKKTKNLVDCLTCEGTFPPELIASASCDHPFCKECWKTHIRVSLDDGPGCLLTRCPEKDCTAAVTRDLFETLADDEDKKMFDYYFVWCYVYDKKKIKWCPAENCELAVESHDAGAKLGDVKCDCGYGFCWNCTQEAHSPLDCETVANWISKRTSESENLKWVLANSKSCPNCRNQIEKNQGNMHIKCLCNFDFCWLCLGSWSGHEEFYTCNVYEVAKYEGVYESIEKKRQEAKKSLERYPHYYERFEINDSSWNRAIQDLKVMKEKKIKDLSEIMGLPETSFDFLVKAMKQIIECRRVLKWTYAYGYFLPEEEKTKKRLFEYLQGVAEAGLEKLHQLVEEEVESYLKVSEGPLNEFKGFSSRVVGLTNVTRKFFKNLVEGLEKGLADVDAAQGKAAAAGKVGPPGSPLYHLDAVDGWMCDRCTFMNPLSVGICTMCRDFDFNEE